MKHIHQICPVLLYGDAVGNQIQALRRLLLSWGFDSEIYAGWSDPRVTCRARPLSSFRGGPDTVLIYHHSTGSDVAAWARDRAEPVVMYYHNVTPVQFVQHSEPRMAASLRQGLEQLAWFTDRPLALAASEYNRRDLLAMGFADVHVVPYLIDLAGLRASADSPAGRSVAGRYRDGKTNWLFVGRLVHNKRQDDLIRAFHYYRKLINPNSRLLLVGSDSGWGTYTLELKAQIDMLGLEDVAFCGQVGPGEGLGGYYRAADVFVCMSEHEGFGIPLIESMAFDVPVVAYASSGVPLALNGAGVLFNQKRFDVVAELINVLLTDDALRDRVIQRQRQRLAELQHDRIADDLRQALRATGVEFS